jgi:hypothetical protein
MSQRLMSSPNEAANRLAIQELVEATRIAPIVAMPPVGRGPSAFETMFNAS